MVVLTVIGFWLAARVNRAGLLWILSLSTRRRQSLRLEMEDLSGSVTGKDRYRFAQLIGALQQGRSLGEALLASPGIVPAETALLTRVAEDQPASLSPIFARESARLVSTRQALFSANSSPTLLVMYLIAVPIVMFTITSGIVVWIVPKFKAIFNDFGAEFPPVSEAFLDISDWMGKYWYILALPGVLGFYGLMFWMLRGYFRQSPVNIFKFWPSSRRKRGSLALRAIEIAVGENLPLEKAITTIARSHPDKADRKTFQRLSERLSGGTEVWTALRSQGLISRRDVELFRAAEEANNLPWALRYVIGRFDDGANQRLAVVAELIQPIVVLAIGAMVAFMCVALFMPLTKLMSDMS